MPHALLLEVFTDEGVGTMISVAPRGPRGALVTTDGRRAGVELDRSALMHTYAEPPVTFVRGEGSELWDTRAGVTSTSSAAWR